MGGVRMIRFLILIGYVWLMMFLQISGKLNQYINVHYRYLAFLSMGLAFLLALVQLFKWVKNEKHTAHHEDDHHHGMQKGYQKVIGYALLMMPIVVGLAFPKVSLDTTIVEAKGFQFPLSKESTGDPYFQTQYLRPDTSIYFNTSDYQKQMNRLLDKYTKDQKIVITDTNYLELMEIIYNYPSEFIGKKIQFKGFVYHSTTANQQDLFLFRFGVIHCIADSGVFGLRIDFDHPTSYKNNDWLLVEGELALEYYAPFKRELPVVKVSQVKQIQAPKNEYVYRTF